MESKEKSKILRKQKSRKIIGVSVEFILLLSLFASGILTGRLLFYVDTQYNYIPQIGSVEELEDFSIDILSSEYINNNSIPFAFGLDVELIAEEEGIISINVSYFNHTIFLEIGEGLNISFVEGMFELVALEDGVILWQFAYYSVICLSMNSANITVEQITLYRIIKE